MSLSELVKVLVKVIRTDQWIELVAKRLDVLATAIYKQMTVFEIAELDLSYSPLYAPVWDPLLITANKAVKAV